MRGIYSVVSLSLLLGAWAGPVQKRWGFKPIRNPAYPLDIVDKLEESIMPNVEAWMAKRAGKTNNCTLENASIRREWSDLSVDERKEYIRAVLCLQSKPPKAPKDKAPGSLSRFDDFVATHMTMAGMLHSPTNLFAAHRYFIHVYEKALREECGYKGSQPYMNYDRYADDPVHSPLFDGSESSMGGNGAPSDYPGVPQPFPRPYDKIPSAGGGGCVTEGPFKDMVVSLGPKSTIVRGVPANPRAADGLGSNPRCLRRDVNKFSAAGAKANYTHFTIVNNTDIDGFYNRYLGQPFLKGDPHPWGCIHNAGHFTIGGDPGGDFYCSPGDPVFYFHHGMLDRVWWIWQMQDPEHRIDAVPGQAAMPMPPHEGHGGMKPRAAPNVSDLVVDLGWTAPPVKLMDLNEQLGGLGGELCYIYV
ncbi:uncharacterized protein B0T15DRAFT_563343 [Chaetomium strumarium]|uniref:Tyrosinase copper-binding domain-containing protein n=1 Tax=Chaetomium strumarium TaxID=1170767 RepID=A0AAJ0GKT0_9PEZI|nr:hypothetical protein B0T15DRAFT_563343 [Chaetomium strumarium]